MSQVFVRSEQLADKIFELKLHIPEWKVLFTADGKMDAVAIADFLDLEPANVDEALNHLKELELLLPTGETVVEEIPHDGEKTAVVSQEEAAETTDELDELFEKAEAGPEEMVDDDAGKEPEEDDFTLEPLMDEMEESETAEAELEEQEDAETDDAGEDLDSLINDLLKEESDDEDTVDLEEFPGPEAEDDAEEAKTEAGAATDEKEDIDLGEIFQSELTETEQSLEEMLDTLETEEAVEEEEGVEDETPPPTAAVSQKTVLVVDDSVVIRKMVEIALENEKYKIVSVANGKDALAYLDEKEPSIVILDIMLPDVNGLDVLKAIKASKNIPVVMLSAKDTPRETSKAKELGADDFIPKPFKDEELIGKIHELIGD